MTKLIIHTKDGVKILSSREKLYSYLMMCAACLSWFILGFVTASLIWR